MGTVDSGTEGEVEDGVASVGGVKVQGRVTIHWPEITQTLGNTDTAASAGAVPR